MSLFLKQIKKSNILIRKSLFCSPRFISSKTNLTGGQIAYNQLVKNNVDNAFVYSGGAIMPLIDCFYDGKINYYINTHEQNGIHAATGYAKSSNKTGVVIVTSGPGLTNLITGIRDAQTDSTPLVVISGQVPKIAMNTNAFQECPAVDITKPITKWSYCIDTIDEIEEVIDKAFFIANDKKKGVVHLDIPKCVLAAKNSEIQKKINDNTFNDNSNIIKDSSYVKDIEFINKIKKISKIINQSKKPIFYIGQGCNNYSELLSQLVVKSNIPITTTIHAMGVFDENHPLSLKFLGMHGSAYANYAIQDSDCIIAIGSRFDDRTTGNLEYYAPEAKKASKQKNGGIIHVNIEKSEINKIVNSDYDFNCDAGIFMKSLSKYIEYQPRKKWIDQLQIWKKNFPFNYDKLTDGKLKTQDVIIELNKQLYNQKLIDNTIITTGVGNHQMMAAQMIYWKKPKSMITSGSLGVMGVGLPYSIGVQIANPNKLVLDIDGDGSFNHTLSDLKTVSEHNLPIKIAILKDGYQSMVKVWEELFYEGRITATKLDKNPDYCKLADAFDIMSIKIDNRDHLSDNIIEFLNYPGPILAEFIVETDNCFPLVAPGKALDDLILHSDMISKYDLQNQLPPN